jgi:TRAP-type C4-dicarboxylate transport system permease small subunit
MAFIESVLRRICRVAAFIGVAAILGLMALTVVTVLFRAIGIAFPGTYSLAELLLIPAVSFALAYAAMENEHTRVVLFVDRIRSKRVRLGLHGVMTALGCLFWVAIAWATIREAIRRMAQNELSPIINVPVAPFRWLMASAIVLLCLVLAFQAIKLLRGEPIDDEPGDLETKP